MKERTVKMVGLAKKSGIILALMMMLVIAGCSNNTATKQTAGTQSQGENAQTATLSITCNSLLQNMDKVPEEKKAYVPQNGIMLLKENVEIQNGETAFNFLQRMCKENNIQMDYNKGMIYVTSIGHIGEKDCGSESGWIYKVNGQSVNVGVSDYKLKAGDKLEFYYILTYAEAF